MYLNGLRGNEEDWGAGWKMTGDYIGPADSIYGPSAASVQSPTSNADWTGLATTALTTWGNMRNAELQSKTAIALAPYQAPFGMRYGIPGAVPSPYYAASPGVIAPGTNFTPLLILAAIGIAAYILLKD